MAGASAKCMLLAVVMLCLCSAPVAADVAAGAPVAADVVVEDPMSGAPVAVATAVATSTTDEVDEPDAAAPVASDTTTDVEDANADAPVATDTTISVEDPDADAPVATDTSIDVEDPDADAPVATDPVSDTPCDCEGCPCCEPADGGVLVLSVHTCSCCALFSFLINATKLHEHVFSFIPGNRSNLDGNCGQAIRKAKKNLCTGSRFHHQRSC